MDMTLTIIALLGLGALVISVYIFAVAARQFVSDDEEPDRRQEPRDGVGRRQGDRRQSSEPITFPTIINGVLVREDRRRLADRRRGASQFA